MEKELVGRWPQPQPGGRLAPRQLASELVEGVVAAERLAIDLVAVSKPQVVHEFLLVDARQQLVFAEEARAHLAMAERRGGPRLARFSDGAALGGSLVDRARGRRWSDLHLICGQELSGTTVFAATLHDVQRVLLQDLSGLHSDSIAAAPGMLLVADVRHELRLVEYGGILERLCNPLPLLFFLHRFWI